MKIIARIILLTVITFGPLTAHAEKLDKEVLAKIAALDKKLGSKDTIDPGIETDALVRYANDKILGKYDKDHDGKVEGDEALAYAKDNLSSVSKSELRRVYSSAYEETRESFAGGVSVSDLKTIKRLVPFVPRTQGFAFGINYGQKGESTKDIETIGGSLEYSWGGKSLVTVPFTFKTKLTYGKENTFVGRSAVKVERWTLQPFSVTVGRDSWIARPTIGLGYGRARTETSDIGIFTNSRDNEYVWEMGLDFPIRMTTSAGKHKKIASLMLTNTVRFEELTSGKRNDELKLGFTISTSEFKTLRGILSEKGSSAKVK